MSTAQITEAALGLPLPERVSLAQRLWESAFSDDAVGAGQAVDDPLVDVVRRRAAELDSGAVTAIPHEQVMADARLALE
jgi:putative addiction module component (TIGR02574 family)